VPACVREHSGLCALARTVDSARAVSALLRALSGGAGARAHRINQPSPRTKHSPLTHVPHDSQSIHACIPHPNHPHSSQPAGERAVRPPVHHDVQHAPPARGLPLWHAGGLCGGRRGQALLLPLPPRHPLQVGGPAEHVGEPCCLTTPSRARGGKGRRKQAAFLLSCGPFSRRAHPPSRPPPLRTARLAGTCWKRPRPRWWCRCLGGPAWPTRGSPSLGTLCSSPLTCRCVHRNVDGSGSSGARAGPCSAICLPQQDAGQLIGLSQQD